MDDAPVVVEDDAPVVVGTDGSPSALEAVDWAADEAVRRRAPLRVVHASTWGQRGPDSATLADAVTQAAHDRVAHRHRHLSQQIEVSTDVVLGDPVSVLVGESETARMLVLGSRGLGLLARALLGSVSLPAVAGSRCPVVVLRPGGETAGESEVVLGVAGRGADTPAARFAFEAAAVRGCPVFALHAWSIGWAEAAGGHAGQLGEARETRAERARVALDDAVRPLAEAFPEVALRAATVEAPAAEALLEAAQGASLVVVGAHSPGRTGQRLGSVNHAMLHHAPCPVTVVPRV